MAKLFKGPDGAALRFFERAARNNFQSEQRGHVVFDTVVYVEVITPGQNESVPEFEIQRTTTDENGKSVVKKGSHYAKYREAADAFLEGREGDTSGGMPIEQWGLIDAGQAETFKAQNVYTVEQLSMVSDSDVQKLGMGAMRLRDQAKAFINARSEGAPAAQLTSEVQELRTENERLRNENSELRGMIDKATKPKTDKPEADTPEDPFAGLTAKTDADKGTKSKGDKVL